jgi:hypothetical protein
LQFRGKSLLDFWQHFVVLVGCNSFNLNGKNILSLSNKHAFAQMVSCNLQKFLMSFSNRDNDSKRPFIYMDYDPNGLFRNIYPRCWRRLGVLQALVLLRESAIKDCSHVKSPARQHDRRSMNQTDRASVGRFCVAKNRSHSI